MFIVTVIVVLLLALAAVASAVGKLTRQAPVMESLATVGVPEAWMPRLAALELAGAVGLVVGLWVAPLGVAAAVGLALYFLGAVVTHVRAGDSHFQPPLVLALLSVAAVVLRLVTM